MYGLDSAWQSWSIAWAGYKRETGLSNQPSFDWGLSKKLRKTKNVSRQQHVNLLGFLKKYWYVAPRYPLLCCSCNATMPIDLQGWCSGRRGILNGNGVIPTVARPLDHHWTIIGPEFHRFQWRNLHALEFFHHTSDMFGDCTSVNQWNFDYYSVLSHSICNCVMFVN